MNLAITKGAQLVYLGDDLRCCAALLSPTRKRHDAVSAELVAAFDNGNEGHVLRRARRGREVPLLAFRAFVKIDNSAFAIERAADQFRQTVRGAGPGDQVYRGAVIEKRRAFQLRHAPHNADNRFFSQTLTSDFSNAREDFVCRSFAHGTSVEDDHVCALRRFGETESSGAQANDCAFAVSDVHLAAKCFEVNRRAHEVACNNSQSLTDFALSFLSIRMRRFAKMFTTVWCLTHRTAPGSIGLSLY